MDKRVLMYLTDFTERLCKKFESKEDKTKIQVFLVDFITKGLKRKYMKTEKEKEEE